MLTDLQLPDANAIMVSFWMFYQRRMHMEEKLLPKVAKRGEEEGVAELQSALQGAQDLNQTLHRGVGR